MIVVFCSSFSLFLNLTRDSVEFLFEAAIFNYPLSERDKRNETRGDLCIDLDKLTDLKSLVVFVVTSLEVYKDTVKLLL